MVPSGKTDYGNGETKSLTGESKAVNGKSAVYPTPHIQFV